MKYEWEESDIVAGQRIRIPSNGNELMLVAHLPTNTFEGVWTGDGNYNLSGQGFDSAWWARYLTAQNAEPIGFGVGPRTPSPLPTN